MKYVWIALGIVVFLVAEYQVGLRRRERQLRAKNRANWGKLAEKRFTRDELKMISSYHRQRQKGFAIDDVTWNDIAMDEVFMALNRTYSSVGEEYFYHVLRTPSFSEEELKERSRLTGLFAGNQKAREDVSFCLSRMGKNYRIPFTEYVVRLLELEERGNALHLILLAALLVGVALTFTVPQYGIMALVIILLINLATYFKEKARVEPYFICIQRIMQLTDAGKRIAALRVPELEDIRREITAAAKQVDRNMGWASLIQTGSSMGGSLVEIVFDYLRMITHMDLIAFNRIFHSLKRKEKEIFRLIELLGELEVALATASLREALPRWCEPVLSKTGPAVKTVGLYHPLITEPVANSIDAKRHVLLTGSNASGKSTFLKTVAINSILAQTLYTAAAESYRSSWFRVYSSMALSDNLFEGESYFIVEIKSLKRIIDHTAEGEYPVLCFIDEVLRGTNTIERIAASAQILKSFAGRKALCFAATHDIELTVLLEPYFDNYHFTEEVRENDVIFPYILKDGPAASRNAIRLLGAMGYDPDLTKKAEETARRFMESGRWSLETAEV